MKDKIEAYKRKLEKAVCEYMEMPVSERTVQAVKEMVKCWGELDEMEEKFYSDRGFTSADAKTWVDHMENTDGTTGAHWTVDQTTSVAKSIGVEFDHITEYCWNATMNMMYSDYFRVAASYGVDNAGFYAHMAKAFLFDKDGGAPKDKLAAYYHCIAEPEIKE